MKRRQFLKAMCFTGLLSVTNWRTLIAGPRPRERVLHGVFRKRSSWIGVAAEPLNGGDVVYIGTDGRLRRADGSQSRDVVGVVIEQTDANNNVEIMTSGWFQLGVGLDRTNG